MEIKIYCFLLLLALGFIGNPSFADAAEQRNWHECREDSDCVVVAKGCVAGAVNKRYSSRVEKYSYELNQEMNCDPEQKITTKSAYCSFVRVECNNRAAIAKGERCFSNKGQCTVRY